jgi:hypothetical protein
MLPAEFRRLLDFFADCPKLDGALCRGFAEIWAEPHSPMTDDDRERIAFARHACAACPALLECARWVDGLPRSQKPLGVCAGVLRRTYATGRTSITLETAAGPGLGSAVGPGPGPVEAGDCAPPTAE